MFPFDFSHPVTGKARIEINKPVKDVFNFVGDNFFTNYPKWALEVSEFDPLSGNDVFIGAKAKQVRHEQEQKVESVVEVSEFEPHQKMTLSGVDSPFKHTYRFSSHDNGEDKTELELTFEITELTPFMWPFEKLIRQAIEEGAEHTVENIKNLLMHGRPSIDSESLSKIFMK